jgi:hypothetical protein
LYRRLTRARDFRSNAAGSEFSDGFVPREFFLKTIRITPAQIGDRTYGAQPKSAPVCARDFPRQALHAERLTLVLPSGVRRTFVAPWPSDLLALRAALAKA